MGPGQAGGTMKKHAKKCKAHTKAEKWLINGIFTTTRGI